MPYEYLDEDIEMMKKAGINTVRIAEAAWSICEPQVGVFDFSHMEKVMKAFKFDLQGESENNMKNKVDNLIKKLISSGTTISTMESCTSGLIAVSYTHLDVYKRQYLF